MKCKICLNNSEYFFSKKILNKYDVKYYKCNNCGFIQTEKPYWLNESYDNAITSLDIGLLNRNLFLKDEVSKIINYCFTESEFFLDYAGGYGVFTRIMRDIGYNFYHYDVYCENLFSKYFDLKDSEIKYFDIVTAFEVLEHLENPIDEISEIFKLGENFIFTTEIIPENFNTDWVYIAQETGQHIGFYTKKALSIIAEKHNFNYYCKYNFIHIFTKNHLTENQINFNLTYKKSKFFGLIKKTKKIIINSRKSLCEHDYNYIKKILNKK